MATRSRKSRTRKETEGSSKESISIHDSDEDDLMTSSTMKKTVTIKNISEQIPMATSTPNLNKSRNERASSPLTIQRHEEKEELAHLNDRLAYYIDYVRSLETVNAKLTKKINSFSQIETSELDNLRKTYDDELKSLRNMVDDLSRQRANLEIELKNAKDEVLNQRRRADRKEAEAMNLQKRVEQLERDLSKQRTEHERYSSLLSQYDLLEKKNAKLTKDYDAEMLLRTDLENRNATLKEQLEFNDKVYREEKMKLRQSQIVIEEEIEDRKQAEFESKLADEMRLIREETASEFESYKMEFEDSFLVRLNELKKTNALSGETERHIRDEMYNYKSKSEKLEHDLSSKIAELDVLRKRVADLESLLSIERKGFEDQLKNMRLESDQLRGELQHRLDEFSALMSTKIALDQEIMMYRKLLEGEESRCNLSVKQSGDSSFSILSSSVSGGKRRKVGETGDFVVNDKGGKSVSFGRESYRVDVSSKGDIQFSSDPDVSGKCVTIFNKSNKDVCVGGWTLIYKADNMETTYKFHHNLHVKANAETKVWSSDANQTHNPPSDLVMKGQRFFTGAVINMSLINADDNEQATCHLEKESIRSTSFNYNRKLASRSIRTNDDSKCSLM